jgi:hypothetical protein
MGKNVKVDKAKFDGKRFSRAEQGRSPITTTLADAFSSPLAAAVGVEIGGWQDFRHTLFTHHVSCRRPPGRDQGYASPSKVDLAMNV